MADGNLTIGEGLSLPHDVITETLLIIAKRGSGKTHLASVLAEEMIGAGLPVCVIDPIGVWWGLRSSADGTGPGLPVTILGGEHADLPLPGEAGSLVADLVLSERLPFVLDLSEMSKSAQRRFMTDFLERLYHRNRDPLHLIIDEADLFAPLRGARESARLLGAYEDIVRRGRARGLGCTSITQRPAVLHTDIRSQAEVLIALRLIGTHDVAAIDEWVRLHATDEEAREVKASLPSLPVGTAWVWSPGWLELLVKVKVRQRRTFDSSATPKVGQRRIMPQEFARPDPAELERLAGRLRAVVEKAAQDDPAALRKRITALERQLRQAGTSDDAKLRAENADLRRQLAGAQSRPPERVEVPVLAPGDIAALEQSVAAMKDTAAGLELALAHAARPAPPARPSESPRAAARPAQPMTPPEPGPEPDGKLGKAQEAILTALAQSPEGRTRPQLAILSGYSAKSSGYANALGALRSAGLINRGDPIRATPEGLAALGEWEPLPEGPALVEHWMSKLGKAEKAILRVLLDAWPADLTRDEVAERAEYSPSSSGFANALGRLRRLQLINGLRADETLAQHARGGVHA